MPAAERGVRAAFRSRVELWAFSCLLLVLIVLPLLLRAGGRPTTKDAYAAIPNGVGPFSYIADQVLDDNSDIDILVLGSSYIWTALDPDILRRALERSLGHPANVVVLGSNWRGEDILYVQLRDILARRRVRMVVTSMPTADQDSNGPHPAFGCVAGTVSYAELAALPWTKILAVYGSEILSAPRHLLSVLRSDPVSPSPYAADHGHDRMYYGLPGHDFKPRVFAPPAVPSAELLYTSAAPTWFRFTHQHLRTYALHFQSLIARALRQRDIPLVVVNIPTYSERASPVVTERDDWAEVLGIPLTLIGLPPQRLFQGLGADDVDDLYYNEHMNVNGAQLFTRTVSPAIVQVFHEHFH